VHRADRRGTGRGVRADAAGDVIDRDEVDFLALGASVDASLAREGAAVGVSAG
jgi:hypothetical protein